MKMVVIAAVVLVILVVFINQAGLLNKFSFSDILTPTRNFYSGVNLSTGTSSALSYGSTTQSSISPSDIPKGFRAKDLSPYFRQVTISSAVPRSESAAYDLITLSGGNISSSAGINLGGWYMRSNTGTAYLPKAVQSYDPSVLPSPQNVVLKSGQTAKVYSTQSPVGLSFRSNKCTGYLNDRYDFKPPLDANCPSPDRQDFATLGGECQEYVLSLSGCAAPDFNSAAAVGSASCRVYLSSLDYPGCYLNHKKDADFLLSDWNLWLGRSFMDPLHDRILLFDKNGLLVDQFIY